LDSWETGSEAVKAIVRPSGDQANPPTPVSALVSRTASPPSGLMTKSWDLSSARLEVKAIHRPSGDQAGPDADFLPRVSWKARPVATSASQIWVT
jgi:hypothetical protein